MDRANTGLNERLKKKAISELGRWMDTGTLKKYSH